MSQIRYREVVQRLCSEFPDIDSQYMPQYLSRWKRVLGVSQPSRGWYDFEDYVGLRALGVAYRRHQYRGSDAIDYAFSEVRKWRSTQTVM